MNLIGQELILDIELINKLDEFFSKKFIITILKFYDEIKVTYECDTLFLIPRKSFYRITIVFFYYLISYKSFIYCRISFEK